MTKAVWMLESHDAVWFEREEPHDQPSDIKITKMVPEEELTDREKSIIRFAVYRFACHAREALNEAAQDNSRHYKAGAVEAFSKDAKDADALLAKLNKGGDRIYVGGSQPGKGMIFLLREEVTKLRGEAVVLIGLLQSAMQVIYTVEGETASECEQLMDLYNKIGYAIRAHHGIKEEL